MVIERFDDTIVYDRDFVLSIKSTEQSTLDKLNRALSLLADEINKLSAKVES